MVPFYLTNVLLCGFNGDDMLPEAITEAAQNGDDSVGIVEAEAVADSLAETETDGLRTAAKSDGNKA
jgi:hypothetical protein